MKTLLPLVPLLILASCQSTEPADSGHEYPYQPVSFTEVRISDHFWAPRIETNRTVTIPVSFRRCEETGRIRNFLRAAGKLDTEFEGLRYNDSDVFKVIEGAAYSLSLHPDPKLDAYLDDLISMIAAAQEEDGYLFTIRTANNGGDVSRIGEKRWSHLISSHELYNVGHLYEAAVAHYEATGKKTLLDVAIRSAGLVCKTFGPGPDQIRDVPGHEEIEIGLVKLYRATGDEKYLDMAKFFVDERGNPERMTMTDGKRPRKYSQDHLPLKQQTTAEGHAVRAGYFYSGATDIAALTGEPGYAEALDKIWHSVVDRRMYLTGGVGAHRQSEGFGPDYELPNDIAYNETCAAIANMLWNHRLFLLHGDAKYIDILERTLYNGFLSGVSLSGDLFFYPNPLSADGKRTFNQGHATRSPWFRTSCCPVNVARIMPSIPGYVYATRGNELFVNLYIQGEAELELPEGVVMLRQETEYPWQGNVTITVAPTFEQAFAVNIRIPGWARNQPIPSGLYRYTDTPQPAPELKVNGEAQAIADNQGFTRIERNWRAGDKIELSLPMPVRRVIAKQEVEADRGLMALERGPLVYCVEGIDNGGTVSNLKLAPDAEFQVEHEADLLGGVTVLKGSGLTAIPYYAWSNRGVGDMTVWLNTK